MTSVRCFLACVVGAALANGAGVAEGTATAGPPRSATAIPEDPQELVRLLIRKPSLIAPLLDMKFLDLLASAQGDKTFLDRAKRTAVVTAVVTKIPAGCRVMLRQDTGGSALAIPPPMNDDEPAQVERIEAAIRGLQAGIEIMATCQPGKTAASLLFGLNLFHDGTSWRIRAWRDLRHARDIAF